MYRSPERMAFGMFGKRRFLCLMAFLLALGVSGARASLWFAEGHRLHRDPLCDRFAFSGGLHAPAVEFGSMDEVYGAYLLPCSHCFVPPVSNQAAQPGGFAFFDGSMLQAVGNASLEEKALLLPGVWTLPSPKALSQDEALEAAQAYVEQNRSLLPTEGPFSLHLTHYDTGRDVQERRETYRALVFSPQQEPVALLYMDALSGEVYGAIVPDL